MALNPACRTFIPKLSPYIDGELPPKDRMDLERHLSACRDCTGRAADLRAESGLVRVGLDMLADEVDFKDFSQKVMARLTPERPPLVERWKIGLGELFTYHRPALISSFATAAVALAVVVPLALRSGPPLGYASQHMAIEQVSQDEGTHIAPVVINGEGGNAIIWLVDQQEPAHIGGDEAVTDEMEMDGAETAKPKPLKPDEAPKGGDL